MVSQDIDDRDSSIVYSTLSGVSDWEKIKGSSGEHDETITETHVQGATASLTFRGISITVFGIGNSSSSTYSVDGSEPVRPPAGNTDSKGQPEYGQLFTSPDLSNGEHTLKITDDLGQLLILDFFRVLSPDIPTTNSTITFLTNSHVSTMVPLTTPLTTSADSVSNPTPTETSTEPAVVPQPTSDTTNVSGSGTSISTVTSNQESSTSVVASNPRSSTHSVTSNPSTIPLPSTLPGSTTRFSTSLSRTSGAQPTTSSASISNTPQAFTSSLSSPAIVGIVIGCLIPLLLAIACICIWQARRRKRGSGLTPYPLDFSSHSKNGGSVGTILDIGRQPSNRHESTEGLMESDIIPSFPPNSEHPPAAHNNSSPTANSVESFESQQYANMMPVAPRTSLWSGEDGFSQTETFVDGVTRTLTVASAGIPGAPHRRGRSLNTAEKGMRRNEGLIDFPSRTGIAI